MKVLIIYHSEHHGNTKKIAKAMAEKVGTDILKATDVNLNKFEEYDNNCLISSLSSSPCCWNCSDITNNEFKPE